MSQYIKTTYHGATNTKGSRISVVTPSGLRNSYPYDHALSVEANHNEAAKAWATRLNWPGKWIAGHGEDGNVYVCCPTLLKGNGFIVDPAVKP